MVVCAALIVRPDSSVYTPQELAHKPVAIDHGNGTAYAALQMLEGAMPVADRLCGMFITSYRLKVASARLHP
jgi:hypothetical protein